MAASLLLPVFSTATRGVPSRRCTAGSEVAPMSSMPRHRLWKFSSVRPKARSGKAASRAAAAPAKGRSASSCRKGMPSSAGLLPGQGQALRAGVAGGQGHAQDPPGAQVLRRHGRHHRAVDAAGKAHHHRLQALLAEVLPQAHAQGPAQPERPRTAPPARARRRRRVSTSTTPSWKNSSRCQVPSGRRQAGAAVEGEPALRAHPGGEGDGDRRAGRRGPAAAAGAGPACWGPPRARCRPGGRKLPRWPGLAEALRIRVAPCPASSAMGSKA